MNFSKEQVKSLRIETGAGIMDCKKALVKTNGNLREAVQYLREEGLAVAQKIGSRSTKEGIVISYIHTGSKLGVILELNCETDFVAKKQEFAQLGKNLAIQIASNPDLQYISKNDLPQGLLPEPVGNVVLLDDICFHQPNMTVEEYIKEHIAFFGENIQVKRFCKFSLEQPTIIAESK